MPLKNPSSTGKLISFEGSEGSGKSTQIAHLARHLQEAALDVVTTREPGGTEIGEQVRNIIVHNSKGDEMCAETELLLFAAARAQLVREVIAPALLSGTIVLSDRFLDSSTVYQGVARNLAMGPVHDINQFAIGNVMPDLTIVIDVPTEVSLARIRQRASDLPDRMERENIDFYEKVRKGYLLLAKSMPERLIVIDGTQAEAVIQKQIWQAVQKRLGLGTSGKTSASTASATAAKKPAAVAKTKISASIAKPAAKAKTDATKPGKKSIGRTKSKTLKR